jgi:hypothetical protein
VGADGTPDSADSAIATLMADSVSNKFKLTAGEKSGTVWLKYFIDEDRYTTSKSSDVFAANDSLEETAIIPVHVTGSDNAGGGDTGGGDVGDGDKSGVGKGDSDKTGDGNGDGGKQTASKSGDLAIAGTDESGIRITIPNKPITGKAVKPTVIIIDGGKKLVQGKDYTITYSGNNVKIGKYKVTIKALPGSVLTGSVTMWYKIVPTKPDKVTIVAKKKALKIKFKTIKEAKAQGVNTYLVYYKQKGAKLWLKKKVAVKKWAKSGELTLTRLKGDKIYQVKLAAFKTIKKGAAKGTYTSAATKVYSKKTRK